MKTRIILTMILSSASLVIMFIAECVYSHINSKKDPFQANECKTKDTYGDVCFSVNSIGGFFIFEMFSFLISFFIENVFSIVFLHIPALWIALHCAHRVLPHINNRIVEFFIKPKF